MTVNFPILCRENSENLVTLNLIDAKLLIHKKTTHQNVLHVFKQKKLQHRKRGGVRLEIRERYCTTLSRPNLIKRVSGGDGIFKLC